MAKLSRDATEVNARIVYWGCEGAGKSANLRAAFAKLRPDHRGKLEEVHAIELAKEQRGKKLTSTWTVEDAGKWKQAKGARRVLVVRAQPAVGWDEDTYDEAPSPDADPIHVPWDDDRTGAVYWLDKSGTLASAVLKR